MPGTGFTENYELPLYMSGDIYDPMGTHNDAMDKIDHALVGVQFDATNALTTAQRAEKNFADIPEMQKQIADNTDHIRIVENRVTAITGTVMQLSATVKEQGLQQAQINVDMNTLREEHNGWSDRIAVISEQNAANTTAIEELREDVNQNTTNLSTTMANVQNNTKNIGFTQNRLDVLENKVETNTTNIATNAKEITAVKETAENLDAAITQTDANVETIANDINRLKEGVAELEKDISGNASADPPSPGLGDRVATLENEQKTTDMRLENLENRPLTLSVQYYKLQSGVLYAGTDGTFAELPENGVTAEYIAVPENFVTANGTDVTAVSFFVTAGDSDYTGALFAICGNIFREENKYTVLRKISRETDVITYPLTIGVLQV